MQITEIDQFIVFKSKVEVKKYCNNQSKSDDIDTHGKKRAIANKIM